MDILKMTVAGLRDYLTQQFAGKDVNYGNRYFTYQIEQMLTALFPQDVASKLTAHRTSATVCTVNYGQVPFLTITTHKTRNKAQRYGWVYSTIDIMDADDQTISQRLYTASTKNAEIEAEDAAWDDKAVEVLTWIMNKYQVNGYVAKMLCQHTVKEYYRLKDKLPEIKDCRFTLAS